MTFDFVISQEEIQETQGRIILDAMITQIIGTEDYFMEKYPMSFPSDGENQDTFRARSFIERYLIERVKTFDPAGNIERQTWNAILDAKSAYKKIEQVAYGMVEEARARYNEDLKKAKVTLGAAIQGAAQVPIAGFPSSSLHKSRLKQSSPLYKKIP